MKFRAWNAVKKQMSDPSGLIYTTLIWRTKGDPSIYYRSLSDSDLLMRSTGLLDKNKVEIYEKDLIETVDGLVWIVIFQDGCFWLYCKDFVTMNKAFSWPEHCSPLFRLNTERDSKVIGNIYANPELLP